MNKKTNFAFFGTDDFAVTVLNTLALRGLVPSIVVTTPDKPKGRHQTLTPSPVKVWAQERKISLLQPEKLRDPIFKNEISNFNCELFVVASYGKIIPEEIFNLPNHKTLNIHPSLLPRLRGPSPIETMILNDEKKTGVTIMQIDAEMDHGAIVAQKEVQIVEWSPRTELERKLATVGGNLLADILPDYLENKIKLIDQNESGATYCKMIEKENALINLSDDSYGNYRKVCAYEGWPRAYFFAESANQKIRVQITEAEWDQDNKALKIIKVIPEGKKEMYYEDFQRGLR